MIACLEWAKELRAQGKRLDREGLSERAIELIGDFKGGYAEVMILAGRLKAITQAAKFDAYWTEQVDKGFHQERADLPLYAQNKGKT